MAMTDSWTLRSIAPSDLPIVLLCGEGSWSPGDGDEQVVLAVGVIADDRPTVIVDQTGHVRKCNRGLFTRGMRTSRPLTASLSPDVGLREV